MQPGGWRHDAAEKEAPTATWTLLPSLYTAHLPQNPAELNNAKKSMPCDASQEAMHVMLFRTA